MMFVVWDFGNPRFLKKLRTESGLCGVFKRTYLEADNADSRDNPHEFMR